jgi:hypothetical protein
MYFKIYFFSDIQNKIHKKYLIRLLKKNKNETLSK